MTVALFIDGNEKDLQYFAGLFLRDMYESFWVVHIYDTRKSAL